MDGVGEFLVVSRRDRQCQCCMTWLHHVDGGLKVDIVVVANSFMCRRSAMHEVSVLGAS